MTEVEARNTPELSDEDKRYFPRWEVENPVYFQLENAAETLQGLTKDLSCAGVCLATSKPIVPEQKIKLTIYLSPDKFVSLQGNVAWVKAGGPQNEIGITFYNTSVKNQDLILQHAFELDRERLKDLWFSGWGSN